MALSDLARFTEYTYSSMTEVLDQQVEKFNGASRGTITMQTQAHQGDYSEKAFFKKISGLVKRRNAYGSGAIASAPMVHLTDRMVKVAAGTKEILLDPGQYKWIQQNPQVAAAAMGQQLAVDTMADMLNTGVSSLYAAMAQVPAIVHDASAATITHLALNTGASRFGDRAQSILAWVTHSKPVFDLYAIGLTNASQLFTYGTVSIVGDAFGRVFVVTDSPSLVTIDGVSPGVNKYHTLGLVPEALEVHQGNEFTDNFHVGNGQENISRTYQAEWTFSLGVRGFAWDKTNGGPSPTDAALATATNWDRFVTFDKDLPGVVVESR